MEEPVAIRIARIAEKIRTQNVRLGPPIPLAELVALETRHGITFPEDYREFILQIGNGTVGRSKHQWIALAKPSRKTPGVKSQARSTLENMKKKFPFTVCWDWDEGYKSHEGTRAQTRHGQVLLNSNGHERWMLIVKGRERGKVWNIHRKGITPTLPDRDFLQWFEDWLDVERF